MRREHLRARKEEGNGSPGEWEGADYQWDDAGDEHDGDENDSEEEDDNVVVHEIDDYYGM